MSRTTISSSTDSQADAHSVPPSPNGFAVYDPGAPDRDVSNPVSLLPAPPWRQFSGIAPETPRPLPNETRHADYEYICPPDAVKLVNAALLLRRPLLITGNPGTGKSTLAFSVARKLGLGRVLRWNITSRSTLKDGLYSYNALQRLHDASLSRSLSGQTASGENKAVPPPPPLENYLRLGPLGTALLPTDHPRVLLIDELDKSDVDLPNDLLHAFEEGSFEIDELAQTQETIMVRADDSVSDTTADRVPVRATVRCKAFPFVVLTSNAEREFPPAFLRRCIRLHLSDPSVEELTEIAQSHLSVLLKNVDKALIKDTIENFYKRRGEGIVANDQLMSALYVVAGVPANHLPPDEVQQLIRVLTQPLTRSGG